MNKELKVNILSLLIGFAIGYCVCILTHLGCIC